MKELKAYISEIFFSLQGEGNLVGLPFLFVRFFECNLRCEYCDTKWNWKKSKYCVIYEKDKIENPVGENTFNEILKSFDYTYLSFTGGEPLLNREFMEAVIPPDKKILIETNGTLVENLSKALIDRVDYWSVDIKLPSLVSKEYFIIHSAFIEKLSKSKGFLILKVVFSSRSSVEELQKSFEIAKNFYNSNKNIALIFQPLTINGKVSFSKKQLDEIFTIMKNSDFEIRVIPQVHKFLKIK